MPSAKSSSKSTQAQAPFARRTSTIEASGIRRVCHWRQRTSVSPATRQRPYRIARQTPAPTVARREAPVRSVRVAIGGPAGRHRSSPLPRTPRHRNQRGARPACRRPSRSAACPRPSRWPTQRPRSRSHRRSHRQSWAAFAQSRAFRKSSRFTVMRRRMSIDEVQERTGAGVVDDLRPDLVRLPGVHFFWLPRPAVTGQVAELSNAM